MPALTIGADDFDVAGPVPAQAWFKFRRYRLDRTGPRLGSDRAWTVPLDAAGNATTALPPAMPGQALVITSNYPGFTQVTVAGYSDTPLTFTELLAYEVDPTTLRASASATAAWELVVVQVQAIVAAAASWAQDAAGSARAAAASALSSATEAAASGTSAFNAGTSAATARGHANDAESAASASSASAAEAVEVANASVIDAFIRVVEEQARLIFRRKNNTEFDVGDIRGPQGIAGVGAPMAQLLGGIDLNTLLTPGFYRQPTASNATAANNYPYPGNTGLVEVFGVNGDGGIMQRFTTWSGASGIARGIYQRRKNGTTWDAWQFIARQRVATTAGRAIYTWDDVNGRDQLIYGDTGLRNVIADLAGGTATGLQLRRVGQLVELSIDTLSPTAAGTFTLYTLPVGFRPTGTRRNVITATGGPSPGRNLLTNTGGSVVVGAAALGETYNTCLTFFTSDAWPTTLPGAALGTIPNT